MRDWKVTENGLQPGASYGQLAFLYGGFKFSEQVCHSNAGYYIGTMHPDGYPYSRESEEYWQTKEEAEKALEAELWTQRTRP